MRVKLASVGNPDFRQDPNKPVYGCEPNKLQPVSSFKQASKVCMKFIKDNELGGGNWSGGEIFDENNKLIGYVSYNGKVWDKMPTYGKGTIPANEIKI